MLLAIFRICFLLFEPRGSSGVGFELVDRPLDIDPGRKAFRLAARIAKVHPSTNSIFFAVVSARNPGEKAGRKGPRERPLTPADSSLRIRGARGGWAAGSQTPGCLSGRCKMPKTRKAAEERP